MRGRIADKPLKRREKGWRVEAEAGVCRRVPPSFNWGGRGEEDTENEERSSRRVSSFEMRQV